MATETEIDIEIQLSGAKRVEKQIDDVQGGLEGLGETGSRLADSLGSTNEKLGEGLENVGASVGELKESFKGLGAGIANLGNTGAKGLLGLLGPLGAVVAAGVLVYDTFRNITGAAQDAQEAEEAMNSASADLQSKLESLAEKGVIPTTKELEQFSMAVIESQLAKESFETAMTKYRKTFEKITQAKVMAAQAARDEAKAEKIGGAVYVQNVLKRIEADKLLVASRKKARVALKQFQEVQKNTLKELKAAGEQEQELEKRSTDSLKAEAKKQAALQREADLIRAKNAAKGDEFFLAEAEYKQSIKQIELEEKLEDANHEDTQLILNKIKFKSKVKAQDVALMKLKQRQIEILKKETAEEKKQASSRAKAGQARRKKREQENKRLLMLDSQLRMMTIKQEQEGIDQLLMLESERHRLTVELTKQGSKERLIEEKRFQSAVQNIINQDLLAEQKAEDKRLKIIKDSNMKQLELEYDLAQSMLELNNQPAATEFGQLQNEQQQRMVALELQYNREVDLARMKGEDINAINQEYAIERLNFDKQNLQERSDLVSDYFDKYGEGFAQAAVGAILFGDSFQESTAKVLNSLAEQAGVESIMSLAKGFAQLALSDPRASASFKAAALFGTAAVVAGAAGGALSGGGGTGASASPSGAPTTAPTPQREEVRNDAMVFNVNFGGAVVYDTKKAAEQALADRLVTILNQPRRGAPRINRR